MTLEITQYKPSGADFTRVGDRLSAVTIERGAVGVDLDTPTWQGEGFYETLGYSELGRMKLGTQGHFDGAPKFKIIYHKEF